MISKCMHYNVQTDTHLKQGACHTFGDPQRYGLEGGSQTEKCSDTMLNKVVPTIF